MNEIKENATPTNFGLMKYVHLTFFTGALIAGWLLVNLINTVWTALNLAITEVPAPVFFVEFIMGAGIAIALAFYMWRHPKLNKLVVEIVTELSKVTWPTRKELYASTVVVLVVSIIAALILGAFDAFWSWATGFIY